MFAHMVDTFGLTNSTGNSDFIWSHSVGVLSYDRVVTNMEVAMVLGAAKIAAQHLQISRPEGTCSAKGEGTSGKNLSQELYCESRGSTARTYCSWDICARGRTEHPSKCTLCHFIMRFSSAIYRILIPGLD